MTMRTFVPVAAGVAMAIAGALAWYAFRSPPDREPLPTSETAADASVVVGVDVLMKTVERYPQEARVEGVVYTIRPEEQLFTLIDIREFVACGLDCPSLILPVRWEGPPPAVKDVLRVRGRVEDASGKLVFVAQALEKTTLGR
jgi:hypothetical protein